MYISVGLIEELVIRMAEKRGIEINHDNPIRKIESKDNGLWIWLNSASESIDFIFENEIDASFV